MQTLPPEVQETVKATAEGRIPLSSSVKNNPIRDAVTQYDPTFNDNRYKMRNEYSSQRGFGAGAQITAAATARAHALTALEAADKLNNTGIHSLNYVKHAMMGLVNDPAAKEFGEAVNALNGEVEKYFKGGAPADRAIERAAEKLNTANTPQESIAALYTLQKLMAGKSVQLEHNWKKTMGDRPVEEAVPELDLWNPRAKIAAKVLENRYKEAFPDYKSEEEKYPTLESVEGKKSGPTNPKIKALMEQYPGYTEQQLKELYEKKKGSQ